MAHKVGPANLGQFSENLGVSHGPDWSDYRFWVKERLQETGGGTKWIRNGQAGKVHTQKNAASRVSCHGAIVKDEQIDTLVHGL